MKIRNGFVSNSSSSSFVLLVDKQSAVDILDQMGSENKSNVLFLGDTFNENTLVFLGWYNDCGSWLCDDDNEHNEDLEDTWDKFLIHARKLPKDKCLYNSWEY